MQLNPGERTLLAYFPDRASAQQAFSALEDAGFHDMQIDSLGPSRQNINNSKSLSSIVYGNSGYDRSFGPLLAANPQVSGMSGLVETRINYNYILTLITDQERHPIAVSIIRQNGGSI
ncbi:MAG TPA: hypothetical protein VFD02_04135 [Syntrophomonadaceae bacterium]|nr:hypothetical protein [Syntrophomonadaceae bacterium]